MSEKDGGPAFPRPISETDKGTDYEAILSMDQSGMSIRDWFAGQALAGVLARDDLAVGEIRGIVIGAYMVADAMLAEREKEQ